MAKTEADVNTLLKKLEALCLQIKTLRENVSETAKGIAQTQQEVDLKLSQAQAEGDRLNSERSALLARLKPEELRGGDPPPEAPVEPVARPVVPDFGAEPRVKLAPVPLESLRRKSKRALVDFLYFFDPGPVIEQITPLVDDEGREVGEILELLAWGPIWEARTSWESPDLQWQRLDEWRVALEQRLAYWTEERVRVANHSLWQQRSESSESEWQLMLEQLLSSQLADNQRVAAEIAKLDAQWQEVQAKTAEKNHG
jgi:hypothetical protein